MIVSPLTAPAVRPLLTDEPIGVYVHFPWCLKKCPYCDFVSFAAPRESIDHRGYADAVLAELAVRAPALEGRRIQSIFFGGGTPSLWDARELGRVLEAILAAGAPEGAADAGAGTDADAGTGAGTDADAGAGTDAGSGRGKRTRKRTRSDVEITVECNPTSLDEDRARALLDVGVNRLSIGVQGLDTDRLQFLGRLHDAQGGLAAVEAALRSGMPRVSADLIHGVTLSGGASRGAPGSAPGDASGDGARTQSPAAAAAEARRVASTGVTHVSAYSLTIEPGTQFGELARRGRLPLASDDLVAETFFAIEEALGELGFDHYEVSNYARPGDEARHNLGYWRGHDYLGLGCAAFGTLRSPRHGEGYAVRYRNIIDPARYAAAAIQGAAHCESGERTTAPEESGGRTALQVDSGGRTAPRIESEEVLDPEARLRERIMLGLRLASGFDLEGSAQELGVVGWTAARRRAADRLVNAGRLTIEGTRLRVPTRARVFTDGIAASLF